MAKYLDSAGVNKFWELVSARIDKKVEGVYNKIIYGAEHPSEDSSISEALDTLMEIAALLGADDNLGGTVVGILGDLKTRLGKAETTIGGHTTTLTSHAASIGSNTTAITNLTTAFNARKSWKTFSIFNSITKVSDITASTEDTLTIKATGKTSLAVSGKTLTINSTWRDITNNPTQNSTETSLSAHGGYEINKTLTDHIAAFNELFEKKNIGTTASPKYVIRAKLGLYSDSFISAYGKNDSTSGSSGTGVNLLQLWSTNLTDTQAKNEYALSAYLGKDLNTRLKAVEVGGATTVNISGTGNAVTNIEKSENSKIISVTKDKTFVESNSVSNSGNTLSWGTAITLASVGGVNITAKLPDNPTSSYIAITVDEIEKLCADPSTPIT